MNNLLTFDVGTTSMKATLFSERFEVLDCFHREYNLLKPQKDWVEIDPEIYWDTLKVAIGDILARGIDNKNIQVITITTQGETLIPIDINGDALYNAIVWLDNRAKDDADFSNGIFMQYEYYRVTGMPDLTSATPIAKLLWIKNNLPEIYNTTHKFLLIEDYLIYKLTGELVSEQSLLSSTGYLDINTGKYWEKILDVAEIDIEKMPKILPCATVVGKVTNTAANETGLDKATIVSTGAMDQISSAVGAGNIIPGIITETTGTALVIAATVEKPNYDSLVKMPVYRHFNENYIYLPYCQTAGIILKWFKDEFLGLMIEKCIQNNISVYKQIDELAEQISAGADGLVLIPNFAGKLSPDFNPKAIGIFYGIGLDSRKGHFIRAILEGVSYMLKENIDFVSRFGIGVKEVRSIGGGSNSKLWSQIKADVLNKPVLVMENSETTSLGAAIMGALSIGLYSSVSEICERIVVKEKFEPNGQNKAVYEEGYRIYSTVYNRLKDI